MRRAFKFRLWTNANQERELAIMLETHRRLYNACLEQRKTAYETEKRSIKYIEQSAWYKAGRATNPFLANLNFSSAQATMRRLDKAFTAFFRRVKSGQKPGYPRFKARDRYNSIEFPAYGSGIRLNGSRLRVQHVGVIRVKVHRKIEGTVKTATLKREAGRWYVVLSCNLGDVAVRPNGMPACGIDVGIESFLTTSDGERVTNPKYLKDALPALRRASRSVSRKKKGSRNRRKAVSKLSRQHVKVRNRRREHHYTIANNLVNRYGMIAVESLNVQGMLRNRRFSRAISDAGWSSFIGILRNKAERAGSQVVEVDPRGTSQECSECHCKVQKSLSVRIHNCPDCGLKLHRDHNAALNILARGLARTGPAGCNAKVA